MGFFSKDKPAEQVFVKGKKLKCSICGHDYFKHREAQLNTKLATTFKLDWTDKSAHCYICDHCSNIQWFLEKL
ncbi:MAG: hypothetical protein DSY82_06705 [Flavobacteriia bacterium]|nr:MAG: hypothetical protein DSY82_06705 [Flavobacteriia bacterium]